LQAVSQQALTRLLVEKRIFTKKEFGELVSMFQTRDEERKGIE
jgi:hypothetical protein